MSQPHLFEPPNPRCQRINCPNPGTVRIHLNYGATGPGIPALLCVHCAAQHEAGNELPIKYNPEISTFPY